MKFMKEILIPAFSRAGKPVKPSRNDPFPKAFYRPLLMRKQAGPEYRISIFTV